MIRYAGSTHLCGAVLSFTDGGPDEEIVLGQGSFEDCERFMESMPGVSYSGDRPGVSARGVVVPWPDDASPAETARAG